MTLYRNLPEIFDAENMRTSFDFLGRGTCFTVGLFKHKELFLENVQAQDTAGWPKVLTWARYIVETLFLAYKERKTYIYIRPVNNLSQK